MSTTAVSEGRIRRAYQTQTALPDGCLVDLNWSALADPAGLYTDPPTALMAPLGTPFASHKGFALAMAIEAFVAGLAGAGHVGAPKAPGNGGLFAAFNASAFSNGETNARAAVSMVVEHCKDTGIPGLSARIPGENVTDRISKALARGYLSIAKETRQILEGLAQRKAKS